MSRKTKQKLKERGGFTTSSPSPRWTYPDVLASFRAFNEFLDKNYQKPSPEVQDTCESGDYDNVVVLTVTERREWLHERREEAGQDPALNDYRVIDPELTLHWEMLTTTPESP